MTLYPKGTQLLAFAFVLLFFTSCASRYKNALFTSKTDIITDTLKTVFVVNDKGPEDIYYKIKPGDQLAVKNIQNLEFGAQQASSGTTGGAAPSSFIVENDGTVNLPVIGKTDLSGLTRREATLKLQQLYAKSLKDPIIELHIVNLKVTILGEFKTPGNYLLEKDQTTLIDILGLTGGLTEKAQPKSIKIIRGERTNPEIIYINLKDINSLANPKLVLQNNDLIYAEPKRTNESLQNSMTYIQPIILLLNTAVIIFNLSR